METAKPRQSLTGIVSADEERVWAALLEASPYQVLNAAPGATRWLVPLVAGPALRASARPQFEQTLTAISSLLGCPARPAD